MCISKRRICVIPRWIGLLRVTHTVEMPIFCFSTILNKHFYQNVCRASKKTYISVCAGFQRNVTSRSTRTHWPLAQLATGPRRCFWNDVSGALGCRCVTAEGAARRRFTIDVWQHASTTTCRHTKCPAQHAGTQTTNAKMKNTVVDWMHVV